MQMEATLQVANNRVATRPEFAEILGRVRKLRPKIESRALATAKAKRVSAETMEALRDADVFRMMQPARFGGRSERSRPHMDTPFILAKTKSSAACRRRARARRIR